MPSKLRAVVFDLDDTLVLSTVDYSKFKRLVIDRLVSRGEPRSMYDTGETVVSILSRYEGRMKEAGLPDEVRKGRLSELDRIMDEVELERVGETKAIRGAVELLELLKGSGIKVGILTRGCEAYATAALAKAGLMHLVDAVECRHSERKAKPNPEAYLRLVDRLGVRKEDSFFVGDHPIDARCAANAGVPFVAVESGDVPRGDLRAAGCVAVFRDVGSMVEWFKSGMQLELEK